MAKRIIVVEDNETLLQQLTYFLVKAGYSVSPLSHGRKLLPLINESLPHMILLDRLLPDTDGFTLCEHIKLRFPRIPIILFSVKGEAKDIVRGLDLGADDYLPKPFEPEVLLAKVAAVFRRLELLGPQEPAKLTLGGLTLFPHRREVEVNGNPIQLTKSEYCLLVVLVQRRGSVISRRDILQDVLGYGSQTKAMEVNIYFHINQLRNKLGDCQHYLQTVRGHGYRLAIPESI